MNTELLFKIFNYGVLIPWMLMVFLPKWKGTKWMIEVRFPVLILAVAYLVLLVEHFITGPAGAGVDFTSMQSIKAAFTQDKVMLIGWLHYLAFDLFVGMWELTDAQKNQLPHYLLVPCLGFTLMYGPVGFVLYWMLRQYFASTVGK